MRDYCYLWRDSEKQRLVLSGVEFRDFIPDLETSGGIVLLRHKFDGSSFDLTSRFEFVPLDEISQLAGDDIYSYGDFCWADFGPDISLAELDDQAISSLTFFAHTARPLGAIEVPGLSNRFLCWAHDDGWYARIFYRTWSDAEGLVRRLLPQLLDDAQAEFTLNQLRAGDAAFWCSKGSVAECEPTEDINSLQRRHGTGR